MKLGLAIGYSGAHVNLPLARIIKAEELGYDSVWSAEAYGSDAVSPLAYIAAVRRLAKIICPLAVIDLLSSRLCGTQ
jgi:alkanesulfonate monooxygenase SsuD/methylene tetrahydromethanopterin reductase-like flavin-dependent oxidoreductase (luciferase family)